MLTLHDYLPSLNGWKIRVLLGQLGIPYQTKPVAIFAGESRTEDFLAKNPVGAIPVLELEDGRSLARVERDPDLFGGRNTLPAPGSVSPC